MKSFEIQFEWLPRTYGNSLEKATLAEIKVIVHKQVLTEIYDKEAKTVRDHVVVSAWDLALWLCAHWWRLRWEPGDDSLEWRLTHYLSSIGGGYIWPDIRFSSDWNAMLIDFKPFDARTAPIRFIGQELHAAVPMDEFEREIDRFVTAVLNRVRDHGSLQDEDAVLLPNLWDENQEERHDPSLSTFRRLEAIAGFDAGDGPDSELQHMIQMASQWGTAAIDEIAAAAKDESADVIHYIRDIPRSRKHILRIDSVKDPHVQVSRSAQPWERGQALARTVREAWSLGSGAVPNPVFADLMGVTQRYLRTNSSPEDVPFDLGFQDQDTGCTSCVLQGRRETTRRFALARLMGDSLYCSPSEQVLPITKAKTDRQKFNRAYAQEFLCPLNALEEYLGRKTLNPDIVQEAADHFNVSPMVVDMTYVNCRGERQLLDRYM